MRVCTNGSTQECTRPRRGSGAPRADYLTGGPSGWRFQMRLPMPLGGDYGLAGLAPIVRAQLGPRSRVEARRLAQQLTSLCQLVCSAPVHRKGLKMEGPLSVPESDLVSQVVEACQLPIAKAIAHPDQAIGFANGLSSALTSLQLIQSEVAKGDAGAPVITQNADALARGALVDVLKLASQPASALEALAKVKNVGPITPDPIAQSTEIEQADSRVLPTFGKVSQAYIDMRIERDGSDHADISTLVLRRQTFIDVIGDRPVDQYYPRDLQTSVNRMQHWPANVAKRGDMQGGSTLDTLEANRNFEIAPAMAKKTMADSYLANIRTMMRHGIQDWNYRDPFAGVRLSYP